MNSQRCSFCMKPSEFEHKPSGKMFCNRCWEKYCKKKDKAFEQKLTEESGVGLYKWVKTE